MHGQQNVKNFTIGSRFVMIHFTTIHFYDPCPVGPSTPDVWCSLPQLKRPCSTYYTSSTFLVCMCFLFYVSYYSTVLPQQFLTILLHCTTHNHYLILLFCQLLQHSTATTIPDHSPSLHHTQSLSHSSFL